MLNIEKYKGEMLNAIENGDDLIDALCSAYYDNNQDTTGDLDVLNWLCEEVQLLTLEEQKYLYCFLHPFLRDYDITIKKEHNDRYGKNEFLIIYFSLKSDSHHDIESIYFPDFMAGTRYKGLENGKEYTLEELGIK